MRNAGLEEVQAGIKIAGRPWRRKWQPTPVFLPGKSQGQRSLVGYSPWGHKRVKKKKKKDCREKYQ